MIRKDKDLLLRDLCSRLPYGVKIWYKYYPDKVTEKFATSIRLAENKLALSNKLNREGNWYLIEEAGEILIKPYLRPMSNMTKEEYEELRKIDRYYGIAPLSEINDWEPGYKSIDWLNKHHFDFRGLIPNNLAIKAPKGMYKK